MQQKNRTAADDQQDTITLSLSVKEKQRLKILAVKENTSVSALIRRWISEHDEPEGGDRPCGS